MFNYFEISSSIQVLLFYIRKTLLNGINGVRKLKLIDNYDKEEILEKIKEKNPFITHEIPKLMQ